MKPKTPTGANSRVISLEYEGQLVLTTKQLAELYDSTIDAILFNFRKHKAEFVEDVDYFFVEGAALRELKREARKFASPPEGTDREARKFASPPEATDREARKFASPPEGADREARKFASPPEGTDREARKFASPPEATEIISNYASNAYLWTKSGALKHSNFLTGRRAKIIFSDLVRGYFKSAPEPEPEQAKATTRLDLLMEMIRLTKDDDLRDKLIREAAELLLGKKVN